MVMLAVTARSTSSSRNAESVQERLATAGIQGDLVDSQLAELAGFVANLRRCHRYRGPTTIRFAHCALGLGLAA